MPVRIVIADDEALTRLDVREILEDAGYEVAGEAEDGLDAVDLCGSCRPDLVLLDVKMPIVDGLTAASMIHEEHPEIALVMMTAYNDRQFIADAAASGASGYVVKPVTEKSLIPTIEIALSRRAEITGLRRDRAEQKKKNEAQKVIARAKALRAEQRGMTENEAYAYLRTLAMRKRRTIAEIAGILVRKA